MFLLSRALHHARVGKDDGLILVASRHAIDHDAVKHTCVQVFLLHIDVGCWNAAVEFSLGNFQFRALLFHSEQQSVEVLVGLRTNHVLEVERYARH